MNTKEFDRWWLDYAAKFPSTARWVNGLPDDGLPLLRLWSQVLSSVDLRDALVVNRQMAMDELEAVGSYDSERERTAVFVKRAALRIKAERDRVDDRSTDSSAAYQPHRQRLGTATSMRDLLGRFESLIKSGRTGSEARAEIDADLQDPWSKPRYGCALCLDRGFVDVWHTVSIRAWLDGLIVTGEQPEPKFLRTCVAPCCCEAGERWIWSGEGPPPPRCRPMRQEHRYDPDKHCRVVESTGSPEDQQRLADWCGQQKERSAQLQARQQSMPYKE